MIIEALFKETPDYGCLGNDTFNDMTPETLLSFKNALIKACKNILKMPEHLIDIVIERLNKYSKTKKVNKLNNVEESTRKTKLMCLKNLADIQNNDMKNSEQFYTNGVFVFHDLQNYSGLLQRILLYEAMFVHLPNYDKIIPLKNKNKLTRNQFNLMVDLYKKNLRIAFPDITQESYHLCTVNYLGLEDMMVARHMSSFL